MINRRGQKLRGGALDTLLYGAQYAGKCEKGQTAAQTGCTPAEGGGEQEEPAEDQGDNRASSVRDSIVAHMLDRRRVEIETAPEPQVVRGKLTSRGGYKSDNEVTITSLDGKDKTIAGGAAKIEREYGKALEALRAGKIASLGILSGDGRFDHTIGELRAPVGHEDAVQEALSKISGAE